MTLVLPEEAAPQDNKKILPRALWTLKALRALNLSQNAFKSCPAGLSQLSNLQFLDLSGCKEMQVRMPAVPSKCHLLASIVTCLLEDDCRKAVLCRRGS